MTKLSTKDWMKNARKALGKMTQQQMATALGFNKSTIGFIENGRSKPTYDQLLLMMEHFNINPLYLLNGTEPMFLSGDNNQQSEEGATFSSSRKQYIPTAQAGFVNDWPQDYNPEIKIPGFDDPRAKLFKISGTSMEPLLMHGDFVICSELTSSKEIRDGLIYIIITQTQGITAKYLRMLPEHIRCIPNNTIEHSPFNIDLDEVKGIWEVKFRITRQITTGGLETFALGDTSRLSRIETLVEHIMELPSYKKDA